MYVRFAPLENMLGAPNICLPRAPATIGPALSTVGNVTGCLFSFLLITPVYTLDLLITSFWITLGFSLELRHGFSFYGCTDFCAYTDFCCYISCCGCVCSSLCHRCAQRMSSINCDNHSLPSVYNVGMLMFN